MLFQTREFIVYFFPVVALGYFLLGPRRPRLSLVWLVLSSLVFYAIGELTYSALFAASVLLNYVCAQFILHRRERRRARIMMVAGVALNLAVLGWFKYIGFLAQIVGLPAPEGSASYALPLGISFYTFQKIAFLVDCYRGEVTAVSFDLYAVFVTFFPTLIAGPIVHHKEIIPQFRDPRRRHFDAQDFAAGASIFMIGMFKKIGLADNYARFTNPIFDAADHGHQPPLLESWAGCLMFTLQIYFDFSAYTDMAIGLARMLRIRLPLNFDSPYKSVSMIEFWRRWHMTLSRFLRDYVYISLGGNRRGRIRRYANLIITMVLGGLWHGANWTFVAWGALHGVALAINHLGAGAVARPAHALRRVAGWGLTMVVVITGWVLFRANSFAGAERIYRGMLGYNGIYLLPQIAQRLGPLRPFVDPVQPSPTIGDGTATDFVFAAMLTLLGIALVLLFPATQNLSERRRLGVVVLIFGFCLQHIVANGPADTFIYFRF